MARLVVRLLGPMQVTLDNRPIIGFESDRVRALLSYLAVESQVAHTRQKLAGLLWPDHPEEKARTNLRRALYNLRKAIGDQQTTPPYLDVSHQTIGFERGSDTWIDVIAFTDMTQTSRPARLRTIQQWRKGIELYRGGFLEGFSVPGCPAFEEWALLQGERLHCLALDALRRLADWYEGHAELAVALEYARRRLELDLLQESAHRQVMRLLAHSGLREAALAQYEICQLQLEKDLGVEPAPETISLYEDIRQGIKVPIPALSLTHSLHAPLTPFIGREKELAELVQHLQSPGCRLITLIGPGGIGKSRLALQVGRILMDHFDHGVCQIRLAGIQSMAAIVPTIAQELGFSLSETEVPRQQLLDYLRDKRLLLVLDSFEHLLEGTDVIVDILRTAPSVRILVTSRSKLNLKCEHLFPVGGLALKSGTPDLIRAADCDAVRLFLSGARRSAPRFNLDDHVEDVVHICRLAEGMPLAILLASAWVGMMSPGEIVTHISDDLGHSLDFLETKWLDVPPRHRSIRAAFDHSWRLLSKQEKHMLTALSVHIGSFGERAASRIAGASLHDLHWFVDKSLLTYLGTGRYEMHGLLRQYAADRLRRADRLHRADELASEPTTCDVMQDRHCAFYTAELQRWGEELKGTQQLATLSEIERDIRNARDAWEWAVKQGQVDRLAQALDGLCRFYQWRGRSQEGEAACRLAAEKLATEDLDVELLDPSYSIGRVLARILTWQGVFNRLLRRPDMANHVLRQALSLLDDLGQHNQDTGLERASVLAQLGRVTAESDFKKALAWYEQSLALYRRSDDPWGLASTLSNSAHMNWVLGHLDEARDKWQESLAIQQKLGDPRAIAYSVGGLGLVALMQGQLHRAEAYYQEASAFLEQVGNWRDVARELEQMGILLLALGRFDKAYWMLEKLLAINRDLGLDDRVAYTTAQLGLAEAQLGRYKSASARAQECLQLSEEIGYTRGIGLSFLLLGLVEVAAGSALQARSRLLDCIDVYQELGAGWMLSVIHSILGVAERNLADTTQAWRRSSKALSIAVDCQSSGPALLYPMAGISLLLADRGEIERAVELYALASHQGFVANSKWFADVIGTQIAARAAELPAPITAAAQQRGRDRDLEATAMELVKEFLAPESSRTDWQHTGAGGALHLVRPGCQMC